ncbi:MAG TPA: sugar ABC transporter substrate-binding protein [bacterium]
MTNLARSLVLVLVLSLSAGLLPAAGAQQQEQITALFISDKIWVPDLTRQFESKTGIHVNVVLSDYGDMLKKLAAAAAAKTGAYDVISGDIPAWWAAGYLAPLERRINALPGRTDLLSPDIAGYKGHWYGMPWLIDNRVFVYNARMLKDTGFIEPPKTWSALLKAAYAMKARGTAFPIMFPWARHEGEFDDFAAVLASFGGRLFDDGYTTVLFNGPEGVAALTTWTNLRRKYDLVNPDALASKSVAVSMTLSQGKAGFGTTWSLLRGMFDDPDKSKVAGQLRVMLYPGGRAGMTGTYDGSESLGLAADSKHPDAAWRYIEFLTSKDVERSVFVTQKILPVWKSLYTDPEMVNADHDLPVILAQRRHIILRPAVAWYNEFSQIMQAALLQAVTGKKSPKVALDGAAAETLKLMKRQ